MSDSGDKAARPGRVRTIAITEHVGDELVQREDSVAVEEPLEIRLHSGATVIPLGITMRTPGNDFELVAGFLLAEGLIQERAQILDMGYCREDRGNQQNFNVVSVRIDEAVHLDPESIVRPFAITSACGVCGRATIDRLEERGVVPAKVGWSVQAGVIRTFGSMLRSKQPVFGLTGGLHAAALLDQDGTVSATREDVGRHNAVDKVIGQAFLAGDAQFHDRIMMVSGRTSYEIMQKAIVAGIPMVCGISAPSSLAVEIAEAFGMTLVGFLRENRFNVYAGVSRVSPA